ncbi:MAG: hypothetical protein ACI4MN_02150 [Candidatus Coproplasma sp.]
MENNNQENKIIVDNAEPISKTDNNNSVTKQTDEELAQSYLEVRGAIRRMGRRREFWTGRRY